MNSVDKGHRRKHYDVSVAVVSFPWQSLAPYKFLSDVLRILEPISKRVILINGNTDRVEKPPTTEVRDIGIKMHYVKETRPVIYSVVLWMAKSLVAQIKTSLVLIERRKDIDVIIFYVAYPYYLLPLVTGKILRKKAIEVVTRAKPISRFARLISFQDRILYRLLDGVAPEAKQLVGVLGLHKYPVRVLSEGARFVDLSHYYVKRGLHDRGNVIGFISRITRDKGIFEFVRAIPLIAKSCPSVEFIVGGSGELLGWVREECDALSRQYGIKVEITGWIGDDLPDYLNRLKCLVLPTYGDGFPTIVLEAMACGTPVLASSVGAVESVIKDSITGFLMDGNSPENIAKNVLRIIDCVELENVVQAARAIVVDKFSYEGAIGRWAALLDDK